MNKIRTVVVEDEPVSRDRLLALLGEEQDIEVVGACADGREAASAIASQSPDLVFLDIQLPEMDGIELARAFDPDKRPAVVFVTAHDSYALPAFEIHALDYLLKPFSAQRFRSALSYAREHLAQRRATTLGRQILDMLPGMDQPGSPAVPAAPTAGGSTAPAAAVSTPAARPAAATPSLERLVVKSSGRIYFVRIADIDWCEAAGNYIRVHVGSQPHLIRETMNRLEAQLDGRQFVRIHRSTIVNVDRIQEMRSTYNGEHIVLLRDGTRLTMSRGYREGLQDRLRRPIA
ncbi:MAG: LytR/AlgR family response regulator transcription factor [Vicinamibacterales bacterium]